MGDTWPGAGDFDDLVRRYRRELHVYCYRMLGSFDEAEDHVQEVLLRVWRSREQFQGRSSTRTWLYRVATNACLDTLRRDARRTVPAPSAAAAGLGPSITAMPWLQPYPDGLLKELPIDQPGPEAVAISNETISLAFLASIQLLPPRQRVVLILRDVVSQSAAEVAEILDLSVAAVNSALQRARATLRTQWPHANGQHGVAGYLRRPGEVVFSPFVLTLLRTEDGRLIEMAAFEPSLFDVFDLPPTL